MSPRTTRFCLFRNFVNFAQFHKHLDEAWYDEPFVCCFVQHLSRRLGHVLLVSLSDQIIMYVPVRAGSGRGRPSRSRSRSSVSRSEWERSIAVAPDRSGPSRSRSEEERSSEESSRE